MDEDHLLDIVGALCKYILTDRHRSHVNRSIYIFESENI
ncbi:hypothetical protein ACP4OV_029122 [Aristida adscensionis]